MIRSTLGAPFGGTTVGGQNGFDCSAPRLITPPNFAGGAGRYFPSMVVVAPGEPGATGVCRVSVVEPALLIFAISPPRISFLAGAPLSNLFLGLFAKQKPFCDQMPYMLRARSARADGERCHKTVRSLCGLLTKAPYWNCADPATGKNDSARRKVMLEE